ncbi:ATPase of 26S proteasome regulatory subunit 4 [Gonapodya sp. JEL0774]|nr:ATPase of 26S proteasome regulatory subunit 4 [Gonapodya sp. JEL0774]
MSETETKPLVPNETEQKLKPSPNAPSSTWLIASAVLVAILLVVSGRPATSIPRSEITAINNASSFFDLSRAVLRDPLAAVRFYSYRAQLSWKWWKVTGVAPGRQCLHKRFIETDFITPEQCDVLQKLADYSRTQQAVGDELTGTNIWELLSRNASKAELAVLKQTRDRMVDAVEWAIPDERKLYLCIQLPESCCAWRTRSALLYLNGVPDISGGEFVFDDEDSCGGELTVQPRCGLMAAFSSGMENPHGVLKVTSGTRKAVAIWFTYDEHRKEYTEIDYPNWKGQNQSGLNPGEGGGGPGDGKKGKDDKSKKEKKKWEPAVPTRVGKKKKKGPDSTSKLPAVFPNTRCKLKLLKLDRIKDYLLLEEEFVQNQERLKPQEEKHQEERSKVDDLRGSPMNVGNLEEIIDDDHAIVSSSTGPEYYVSVMSFVDKDLLEPGCSILMHHKSMSVIGVLGEDVDPMVSVMKLEKAPTESYADVGGLEQQIQEIKEAVELPLTHPELYEEMGIKPPKGVILYGVPGTGKTLLAKAVANQTSATFLRVVGSELIQKYLGDGPKLVRELFRVAEENAPSIVFIDEIDAIGTKRYESTSGGEREIQRTMLELLNQLDGFDSRGDVKVIMATNRIESLDPALIRPGRIDRKIEFPMPDVKTRRRIFGIHTGRMQLAEDVDLEEFVMAKDDLSGADIKAVCTEAGLLALRERRMKVNAEDFRKAKEKVLYRKSEGTPEGLYL